MLTISRLKASIENKEIIKGLDLKVRPGEMHVLMGPNGSGKSTLAQVIAGHPNYKVSSGDLRFSNYDLRKCTPDKRAKLGIFLGFQQPVEVPGVSVFNFLRRAKLSMNHELRIMNHEKKRNGHNSRFMLQDSKSMGEFRQELLEYASSLKLGDDFLRRSLNEGFSGGEKKRNEILQMMALRPKLVILDEIDSGLDVDGLRIVAESIKRFAISNKRSAIILITHYARILKYLKPDFVHVMVEGKIVKSGNSRLAAVIEKSGYERFQNRNQSLNIKNQNYNLKFKNF